MMRARGVPSRRIRLLCAIGLGSWFETWSYDVMFSHDGMFSYDRMFAYDVMFSYDGMI